VKIKVSRKWWLSLGVTVALLALVWAVSSALAQTPGGDSLASPAALYSQTWTFTYQGRLSENGTPANGTYDFATSVYTHPTTSGSLVATCIDVGPGLGNYQVNDGLFTFHLLCNGDNSTVFTGGDRWLEVQVARHGTGITTTLARQPIAPAPYAFSLFPGAVISGTATGNGLGGAILNISNGSSTYPGLFVQSNSGTGVAGLQAGYSPSDTGLWRPGGFFGGQNGVIGISKASSGYGVYGQNQATSGDYSIGIYGESSSSTGWAGYFWNGVGNGVYISAASGKTGLTVANGTKNAVVRTDEGSRLLYSEESTEVWFADYGFGQLEDGVAVVVIDELFAQTVNLEEPYHVFVQVYGDADVYVSGRTPTRFEVRLRDGDPDVEFSYRIVAKRLGYEDDRLEPAPWADSDPNLYPEGRGALDAQGGAVQPLGGSQ
jgi:hypothetical protein